MVRLTHFEVESAKLIKDELNIRLHLMSSRTNSRRSGRIGITC